MNYINLVLIKDTVKTALRTKSLYSQNRLRFCNILAPLHVLFPLHLVGARYV